MREMNIPISNLKEKVNYKSKKGIKHDYLFKGLLYCAECGARLNITY